jgi:tetratricopeptide repeat protein 8
VYSWCRGTQRCRRRAQVWHNVGQLAIGIGDLGLAYQAFKIAVSLDINHAESFNNLGVLELRKHV